jgi:nucleoside diphosphate kinase
MRLTEESIYERYDKPEFSLVFPSSKMLKAYGYKFLEHKLILVFKPNTYTLYEYSNVPEEKFRELDKAISKGQYVTQNIKGKHAFRRHYKD